MISLGRHRQIAIMLLLFFCLLAARLWQINLSHGADYVAQVQHQRLLTVSEREYERGDILDCQGQSLTNRPENVLLVFPRLLLADKQQSSAYWLTYLNSLLKNFNLTPNPQSQSLKQLLQNGEPFILARSLTERQMEQLAPLLNQINGLYTTTLSPRYSLDSLAVHLIGYVGASTAEEAAQLKQRGSQDTSYSGKSGLEKQYDSLLREQASSHIAVTVDEKNQPTESGLRFLADNRLRQNLQLTLNSNYQSIAEAAMQGKNGAVVLMDVHNGDVLALVSTPGYNQYVGQPATSGDDYVNKALSYYPPASVFKIVLCLAALDNQITIDNGEAPFQCNGRITLPGGHSVGCWKSAGHGEEDLSAALGNSCNPYFIQLGQSLGGDLIAEYAYRLGMTEQVLLGFNLGNSSGQLDFNPKVPADVANVSIGEKGIRATPLMLARLLAAVANDGKLPTPRLVQGVVDSRGKVLREIKSPEPQQVVKPASARQVKSFLIQAVQKGTGAPAASDLISIAGKTGTSQNFGVWFAGFFPADEPHWSIAVYISDGQSGGSDAGGVCREIAEKIALLEDITNQSRV